ncbi:MAG: hypothetical protein Q4B03_05690 [Lachnospiraceae bacterium]|nr:hypothetical protein [Lachnospiraceae bacterium]
MTDPGVLFGLIILLIIVEFFASRMGHDIFSGLLLIFIIICAVLLLLQLPDLWEKQQPLRDSEAAYAVYVEDVLESYGYEEIEVEYGIFSNPIGGNDDYSPYISAVGIGDPDYNQIYHMMKELNTYEDRVNGYLLGTDDVKLTFNGELGYYSYSEYSGLCYDSLRTEFEYNDAAGGWIPEKPIRGMGAAQVYNTLLGDPDSVTENEEGISYLWVTGERDNYEAIVSNDHVSCVRVMDTWRGSTVWAEDGGEDD